MRQEDFNEEFRRRTKQVALDIIRVTATLKYSDALGVIRKQLIRACTSVASNFRASCRSRSQRELFSKLCSVVEEADETEFWLEMLIDGGFVSGEEMQNIIREAREILLVMSSYRKSVQNNM